MPFSLLRHALCTLRSAERRAAILGFVVLGFTLPTAMLLASPLPAVPSLTATASAPSTAIRGFGDVLYDQLSGQTVNGFPSQDFTDAGGVNDMLDAEAADDFEVPESMVWTIVGIDVPGFFGAGAPGPADTVNVAFYEDNAGLPGNEVCSLPDQVPTLQVGGVLTLDLSMPCEVGEGRAWVSVQVAAPLAVSGQWFWFGVTPVNFSGFAWRNPGDGFTTGCTDFTLGTACGAVDPDLAFALRGTAGRVVTELPIPTLDSVGLAVLISALGLGSLIVLRRREGVG